MNVSSALNRWLPFLHTRSAAPRRKLPHRSKKRRLRFENLENRHLLSVNAFDDPTIVSDAHYRTNADATLGIAAQYGVLANDIGAQLVVTSHDGQSHNGAAVTVNIDGSVAYDPRNSAILKSLAAGETVADTFTYSISGAVSDGLFAVNLFQISPSAGVNDHDLDTATETFAIWNALDQGVGAPPPGKLTIGAKTYFVNLYESDVEATINYGSSGGTIGGGAGRFVPNLGYESIHGDGPGGSAGTLTGGEDFSVRARTFITFDNAGTYTLAVGSDDGRRVAMSYPNGTPFHFQTAGGQLTGFTNGDSVMKFEGTTGHLFSMGVFTVNAGDVIALDTFFFERTAGDSFEIAIKPGIDTAFGIGTDGFSLLADGALGGTIHLSSTLAPLVPQVDSATVNIQVVGVNDTPVAIASNLTVGEDGVVTSSVLATDPDSDGAPNTLTYSIDSDTPAGHLDLHNDGTFTFDTAGDFNYLPVGSTLDIPFTFVATDQHGATSNPATVVIHVVGANDTPVAVGSHLSIGENDAVTASCLATDPDTDGTPNTLTYSISGDPPATGHLHVNADGTFNFDTADDFDYLPVGSTADVTFAFVVTDQHGATSDPATVVIHVAGVNDTPTANSVVLTVGEDAAMTVAFPAADAESDPSTLTYSITSAAPAAGLLDVHDDGTFTFDTAGAFNYLAAGSTVDVSFTFVAMDQQGATSDPTIIVIRVEGANDTPIANSSNLTVSEDDAVTASFPGTDADVGSTLTYSVTSDEPTAGHLQVHDNGTFTFDTAGDFDYLPAGSTVDVSFTFVATDQHGATSDPATIVIRVVGVNDTPIGNSFNLTVGEDAAVTVAFPATDADSDPSTLIYSITSDPPAAGLLYVHDDGTFTFDTAGEFNYLPAGATADVSFTFLATDQQGATSDPTTVVIRVVGANDKPTATDSNLTVSEDAAATGSFLANDPDAGSSLTYSVTSPALAAGRLQVHDDGTFTFDAAGDFDYLPAGSTVDVSFTFVATDQHGAASDPATVIVHVVGANDKPTAINSNLTVSEDGALTAPFLATDPDAGSSLKYSVTGPAPAAGRLQVHDDGTFTFDTAGEFNYLAAGSSVDVSFKFVATDQHGGTSNPATIVIRVVGANDKPTAINSNLTISEDGTVTGSVRATDPDAGSALKYSVTGPAPAAGRLQVRADGTFTYDTAGDFNYLPVGSSVDVSFTFVATDQFGATSDPGTVVIHVEGRNDAPRIVSPIQDVLVSQNSAPTTIKLSNHLRDPDTGDTLTYVAVSGDGKVVQTTVVGDQLTLKYPANATGSTRVTVTATDRWGVSTSASFAVAIRSPRDQILGVLAVLVELRLNRGIGTSEYNVLGTKIVDALKQFEKSNIKAGVNALQAFNNQVQAFVRSGRLSVTNGNKLIALSNDLITSVGGGKVGK